MRESSLVVPSLGAQCHAKIINHWNAGRHWQVPLVYQAIKLTLDKYKRVERLKSSALVSAALKEQKQMNLPWYKTIQNLLQIDNIYHKDHVSAFRELYPLKSQSLLPPKNSSIATNSRMSIMPENLDRFTSSNNARRTSLNRGN